MRSLKSTVAKTTVVIVKLLIVVHLQLSSCLQFERNSFADCKVNSQKARPEEDECLYDANQNGKAHCGRRIFDEISSTERAGELLLSRSSLRSQTLLSHLLIWYFAFIVNNAAKR